MDPTNANGQGGILAAAEQQKSDKALNSPVIAFPVHRYQAARSACRWFGGEEARLRQIAANDRFFLAHQERMAPPDRVWS